MKERRVRHQRVLSILLAFLIAVSSLGYIGLTPQESYADEPGVLGVGALVNSDSTLERDLGVNWVG